MPVLAAAIIEVDGRAAHALDAAGVLEVGPAAADEDHVVLGVEVDEDRENLDLEPLNLRALEDG
jgi:hypothetical protein